MLYRLFPFDPAAEATEEGGALFVARALQGRGRHDVPARYGAFYASRSPVSPVAERLRRFRGRRIGEEFLRWAGDRPYAIAALEDARIADLVDLDDPRTLSERELRPSGVATRNRKRTQRYARAIHDEGATGFEWWSTIEASWINVTLFAHRALDKLALSAPPDALTLEHPAVHEAAEALGIPLG